MRALFLSAVVLLAACGGSGPRTVSALGDLKAPWYAVSEMGVDTSTTTALDADGTVWKDASSPVRSTPLTAQSVATAAQRSRVQAAFAALPAPDTSCAAHTFLQTQATRWPACTNTNGQIVQPYAEAVSALNSL